MASSDEQAAIREVSAWKMRRERLEARAFAAHHRDLGALGREEAAKVRDLAARIRVDAAKVRDDGARTRDDAARVRDAAARVRDHASLARDLSTKTREEALRRRLARGTLDRTAWTEVLNLDRLAAEQSQEATTRDREAAELDRSAADKDREAADRDRTAATRDREAADKDREASEKDRAASDADRAAADSDRAESERDLHLAEARVDHADRLATLGALAAGISHEINNPLAVLGMSLDGIRARQRSAPRDDAMASLIEDARIATERITSVVTEMRAWLSDGASEGPRQPIDVPALVEESLRLTHHAVEAAAVLVVDLEPVEGLVGVPARLGQVLTNLLLNAARAIRGPIAGNEIRVRVRSTPTQVVLSVTDTGTGITPEVLTHLFDPFFTTHEGSGGMGLGLAMCERIVDQHGGAITVETEVGRGSTFSVTLPRASAASTPPTAPQRSERGRVLVIDDDAQMRRSLGALLGKQNDVGVAENGAVGLAMLTEGPDAWDVVLCDLMMPVMNGRQMYERLLESSPAEAARIVFMTGGATTPETSAFLAALPNVLLTKPFDLDELRALIAQRVASRT